jgi:hypothetical protein
MEWYWIATIVTAFIGLLIGFYFMNKKGVLTQESMNILKTIVDGVHFLANSVDKVFENQATDIFDKVVSLLQKAVYAAENLWYNKEIEKDERKAECLHIFEQLLVANNIELTPAIKLVLDSLIAAICEEMGHTVQIEENK